MVSAARSKSHLDFCPKGSVFESSTKTVTREKYLSHLGSDGREEISPLGLCLGILPSGAHQWIVRPKGISGREAYDYFSGGTS